MKGTNASDREEPGACTAAGSGSTTTYGVPELPASYLDERVAYDAGTTRANVYVEIPVAEVPMRVRVTTLSGTGLQRRARWGSPGHTIVSPGTYDLRFAGKGPAVYLANSLPGGATPASMIFEPWPTEISALGGTDVRRPSVGLAATYKFQASGPGTLNARVQNRISGAAIRTLRNGSSIGRGEVPIVWDGKDAAGIPVPDGRYALVVETSDLTGQTSASRIPIDIDETDPVIRLAKSVVAASEPVTVVASDTMSSPAFDSLTLDGTSARPSSINGAWADEIASDICADYLGAPNHLEHRLARRRMLGEPEISATVADTAGVQQMNEVRAAT